MLAEGKVSSQPYFIPRDYGLITLVLKKFIMFPPRPFQAWHVPSIDTLLWFIKMTPLCCFQTEKKMSSLDIPRSSKKAAPVECWGGSRSQQLRFMSLLLTRLPVTKLSPCTKFVSCFFARCWPLQMLVICYLFFFLDNCHGQG